MKINSKMPSSRGGRQVDKDKKSSKSPKSIGSSLFSKILGSKEINSDSSVDQLSLSEQIEMALQEVDSLGRELSLKKNMESLAKFRDKIKQVIKRFQGAFTNNHFVGEDQSGTVKQLYLSRVINDELKELTQTLMGKQKPSLEIAASVDNIKGLLIDYLK